MTRSLFCLLSSVVSGANKVLIELASRLSQAGQHVDVFIWGQPGSKEWFPRSVTISGATSLEEALADGYDFVLFSHLLFVPLALPQLHGARPVLFYQGHESYCHGNTYAEVMAETSTYPKILSLPIDIICVSRSLQSFLRERFHKESFYVPPGIDKALFHARRCAEFTDVRKRVLMVGSYLFPLKGMNDAFAALDMLFEEMNVQLVLLTQEKRARNMLTRHRFPVEIHYCPEQEEIPGIYASCHVYCCSSWYEGLGLPALEAFSCGLPVVSTKHQGVADYGVEGVNLLLAEPNNPLDLYCKLKLVLSDYRLVQRLTSNAFTTVEQYDWEKSVALFLDCQATIASRPSGPDLSRKSVEQLLEELELEGLFTPLPVQHKFLELSQLLRETCVQLVEARMSASEAGLRLASIRDGLKPYLANSATAYYQSFKSRYDLCRLLLALQDDRRFLNHVRILCAKGMP